MEGAKRDGLMEEEELGVVGEGHVLAEGDGDDVDVVMDGGLEGRSPQGRAAATHSAD